jgi:hypothetical protein
VVTGLIANLLAEEPNLTVVEVIDRLEPASRIPSTSTFQANRVGPPPYSDHWGYGLIDAPRLKP